MRPTDFDVNKIIETCQGTCTETLQSALDYHYPGMQEEELTEDDHNDIDDQIFMCNTCGWWCESSEESEEAVGDCRDCAEEEN